MRRIAVVLVVLALAPGLAVAQRHGSASGATRRTTDRFGTGQDVRIPAVSRHELEDLNPIATLLDKHGDLGLTDEQTSQLKTMNQALRSEQEPAFHTLDSLNLELANLGSNPTNDDAARARTLNILTRMVANGTRQRYDSAEAQALTVLTEAQKQKASDILKDDHERLDRIAGRGAGGG